MKVKSDIEINKMREGGKRLSAILRQVSMAVRVGMATEELDTLALGLISKGGDLPAFLHYKPEFSHRAFPATLCVSINDEVVHGIPGKRILLEGDIVGLDLGLEHEGLFVDMAVTVPVGIASEADKRLMEATGRSLKAGLAKVAPGVRLGDIGAEVERVVETAGFSVVRELGGHGVGHEIHEPPFVPHFGPAGKGDKFELGQTICIEPMVSAGRAGVIFDQQDGYTVRTADGSRSAHYEVTLAVTDKGADILTPIFW